MDAPTPRSVAPGVYFLEFPIGYVYLWDWGGGLTIVDTSLADSAEAILGAVAVIGRRPDDVKEIVLSHFHRDHAGSAAELARRTGARAPPGSIIQVPASKRHLRDQSRATARLPIEPCACSDSPRQDHRSEPQTRLNTVPTTVAVGARTVESESSAG
jgi:glyoxylase-like metal-dependent hydrolase (beta-lactamase superfamily II)